MAKIDKKGGLKDVDPNDVSELLKIAAKILKDLLKKEPKKIGKKWKSQVFKILFWIEQ